MLRLLVVEDFPPLAKALLRALRQAGFQVQMAASRAEARHVEGWFDAAIVDLELPDGSGIDVVGQLNTATQVGKVIFFTACADQDLLAEAAALGRVVDKAAGVAMLLQCLNQRLAEGDELRVAVGDVLGASVSVSPSQRSGTRRMR